MKKSDELKQKRAAKQDELKRMHANAEKEKRSFTAEEQKSWDDGQAEIKTIEAEIRTAEQFEAMDIDIARRTGNPVTTDKGDGEGDEKRNLKERYSIHRAINSLRTGKLEGLEKEMHDETVKRAKDAGVALEGVAIPADFGTRSEKRFAGQSVAQDGGDYGGALVTTDQQTVIDYLRPKPIVSSLGATYLTGLQGNLEFPVNNGGISATWAGEVDELADSKNQYGTKTMTPKRLGCAVPISLQNLMQSSIDLEAYTMAEINSVMANALDLAAINGSGTGNVPLGILNAAGINTINGGTNGAAPTWAQIVALETAVYVANANAAKMGYAINAATKGRLKTTKHEAGDLGYLMTMDNTINGYPVGVSNLIPGNITKGTGTNLSAGIFGDFSQLVIGQWGWLDVTIDNVSKKRSGYIEVIVNMFADVLVKQPKSFSAIKDWVTV